MSLSVRLICPQEISISSIKKVLVESMDDKVHVENNEIFIHNGNFYVILDDDKEYQDEYLQEILDDGNESIVNDLYSSVFFSISYNHTILLNEVLQLLLTEYESSISRIWIDNDDAVIIPGKAVLDCIIKDIFWDIQQNRGMY